LITGLAVQNPSGIPKIQAASGPDLTNRAGWCNLPLDMVVNAAIERGIPMKVTL